MFSIIFFSLAYVMLMSRLSRHYDISLSCLCLCLCRSEDQALDAKTDNNLIKYNFYRNKIKYLIIITKETFYINYFASNINNITETWKRIKQIINLKKITRSTAITLKSGNYKVH